MLFVASAFLLGFLHGLGADHLMAIAALSSSPAGETSAARRARALGVAVRFALGHAVVLAAGTGALIALGWSLPLIVESGGEIAGGVVLIALGAVTLWSVRPGGLYGHTHVHDGEPVAHWHLHFGRPDRHPRSTAHSHVPTIIGAAFAVSSLRALTLLTPFGTRAGSAPLPVLLGLILVFAAGVLLSMSLFGVALARILSARVVARLGRAAVGAMGIASVALGTYWIYS